MNKEFSIGKFWNHPSHSWIGLIFRLIIGITFIIAAVPKISKPMDFAWSIAMYRMVPYKYIYMQAIILPWVEMIVALTFIIGFWTRASSVLMCGMLLMFIIALTYVITKDIEMTSCGCFSPAGKAAMDSHQSTIGKSLLYRDYAMFFAAGYVWLFDSGRIGIDGLIRRFRNGK
jgi:putative oxidoreductase